MGPGVLLIRPGFGTTASLATNYELLVQTGGRWTLEAQFASHQRQAAIAEAQELAAQSHIDAAKVIRSTVTDEGLARETTIFNSDRQKTGRLGGGGGGGRSSPADIEMDFGGTGYSEMEVEIGGGSDWDEEVAAPAAAPPRAARVAPTRGLMGPEALVLYKMFIIAISSLGFAALMTYVFLQMTSA